MNMTLPKTGSLRNVQDEHFRVAIRWWLENEVGHLCSVDPAPEQIDVEIAKRREFARGMFSAGWAGLLWPVEYGGRECTLRQHYIFAEEAARAGAPEALNRFGVEIAAPMMMELATPEQCERFLPEVLSCDRLWCQGFSEPDAGSDLASLRTRAVQDGDRWAITGEKVWTTLAEVADVCLVLARTDNTMPKHRGIGAFVVNLNDAGVDIQPIQQIDGPGDFCSVGYDQVTTVAGGMIGGSTDGWRVAMRMLFFERGTNFVTRQVSLSARIGRLIDTARAYRSRLPDTLRQDLADLFVRSEQLRAMAVDRANQGMYRSVGNDDIALNSAAKLFWSETYQRFGQTAIAMGGCLDTHVPSTVRETWRQEYLASRASTIYAGTSEIQRNIIAERGLNLPTKEYG